MDPNGPNAPEKSADDGHPKARQASDSLDPGHNFVISNGCQEMTLDPSTMASLLKADQMLDGKYLDSEKWCVS